MAEGIYVGICAVRRGAERMVGIGKWKRGGIRGLDGLDDD